MRVEFDIKRPPALSREPRAVKHEAGRPITLEVIRDVEAFASLQDGWNRLAEQSAATVFQTHEWLFLWWKHFGAGGNRTLHTLIARNDRTIVGIIPLFLEKHAILGMPYYRRLRLLGSGIADASSYSVLAECGPSDFLDLLALPPYRSRVAEAFVNYLEEHPFVCDEVALENVPDESVVKKQLLPWLEASSVPYETRQSDICPRLDTPSSIERYLHGLHSSVRRRLVQAQRAYAHESTYVLETISPDTMSGAFHDLVDLHQTRWNRLGYPGLFHDTRFQRFLEDVLHAFWDRGWIWFKSLRTDSMRIAARMGYTFNGRMYDYLSGFDDDPRWSKLRPGLALFCSMLEDSVALQCECIELLRGKEQYKFELTSEYNYNWDIRFFPSGAAHTLRAGVYRITRWFEYAAVQMSKERILFLVQLRQHGTTGGAFQYVSFRTSELAAKVSSWFRSYYHGRNRMNDQPTVADKTS
jgi:CelD/BcsL family acetyltransferase involved in cellulose biosynthesis